VSGNRFSNPTLEKARAEVQARGDLSRALYGDLTGQGGAGAWLYDRLFSIIVANDKGQALELGALRCRFQIRMSEGATPNNAYLHITNLSRATASRMKVEFTRLEISAGYQGRFGSIFTGTIVQSRYGRDSPTDTYCGIVALDGDPAHNQAVINKTLAAGSKPEDAHREALTAMSPYGVTVGYTDPKMTGDALPRGRVLFGMARDTLHKVASTTDTQWSIQHGRVIVTSRGGYLPNDVVVLNAKTGVIGMPHIAPDGIYVRCLLDPMLKVGTRVKLDNASIQSPRVGPDFKAGGAFAGPDGSVVMGSAFENQPHIESDGQYKVLAVDHTGDTRGNDWYSDLACIAATQGVTQASAARGRSVPIDVLTPLPPSDGRRDKG
jgi:hypothetical protein